MKVHYSLVDDSDIKTGHLPVTSLKFCPASEDAKTEHKHLLMASCEHSYHSDKHTLMLNFYDVLSRIDVIIT